MKIEVTEQDIACGRPRSTSCCPIALAAQRLTGEIWIVGSNMMWKQDSPRGENIYLPPRAQLFIEDFDEGDVVAPFSFEI